MYRPTITALLLLGLVSSAAASGVPYVGAVVFDLFDEASLVMQPDGSGPPLTGARSFGGTEVDATIRVLIVDSHYYPVANFPAEDIWLQLELEPGNTIGCTEYGGNFPGGVFVPDGPTDADGFTEWVEPLLGGGWSEGPTWVYLNGERATGPDGHGHPSVSLRANSADISGDRRVNLTDITLFTQDFRGDYHYRSDFYWDGVVDLTDVVLFVYGLGATCP